MFSVKLLLMKQLIVIDGNNGIYCAQNNILL